MVILGFPANNFGVQKSGTNEQIQSFCSLNYGVSFPMYAKVSVKGDDQTSLYQYLTKQADPTGTGDIQWNFTKFLAGRAGKVLNRFEPNVVPEAPELISAVEGILN